MLRMIWKANAKKEKLSRALEISLPLSGLSEKKAILVALLNVLGENVLLYRAGKLQLAKTASSFILVARAKSQRKRSDAFKFKV